MVSTQKTTFCNFGFISPVMIVLRWSLRVKGKDEAEPWSVFGILRPDSSIVLSGNHATNRQPEPTAREIGPPSIGCIFVKNALQIFGRDGGRRISNIDAIGVW